jgi:prephenate dehydrogenase
MNIAIIGVGLIGGSIGLAARRLEDAHVRGFDLSASALARAVEVGAIDEPAGTIEQALERAGVCFVCCPVGALGDAVVRALEAGSDCVVTDVGSTKQEVVEAVRTSGLDDEDVARFVGGHPLAGAEASGVDHAREDLFDGAVWYLTPTERSSGMLYERLYRTLTAFGARPAAIDAGTHDRLMATVSHVPHVLANVLVSQAGRALLEEGQRLPATGPSFRDATRVAGTNPRVWRDIFLSNREAIETELEAYVENLRGVLESLRRADEGAIERWIEEARSDRQRLLELELSGPVSELRILVPNKPGIVAQVTLALGEAGVNIVDMALYPAPDMQSGAIALWVAGEHGAERALELVAELGYPTSVVESGSSP